MSVDLCLTDDAVDHVQDGVDVSIRFRHQLSPGLAARLLADVPMVFCAAPAYLARAGRPSRPEDLADHDCLVFRVPQDGLVLRWGVVRDGVRFEPDVRRSLTCNDVGALAMMAVAGGGVTRLASFLANDLIADGLLEPLFLDNEGPGSVTVEPLEFYACYQDRRDVPLKVRRFIDDLVAGLAGHPKLQALPVRRA
ncbi:MAG TPA: substrate binding domain-containing protein [Roseateles sp.]